MDDPDLETMLTVCALRFDGYAWVDAACGGVMPQFDPADTALPEDDLGCLGRFFALQRFLGKWGGEPLPPDAPERIAFLRLFLRCHNLDIPERWRSPEYHASWESRYKAVRAQWAARVRARLERRKPGARGRTRRKPGREGGS